MFRARSDALFGGRRSVAGQGIVEYGLILGLAAVFAAVVLLVFGGPLADVLAALYDAIDG